MKAALGAFERGHFLLVVDDRRISDPAERLRLSEKTRVRLWRLVLLMGMKWACDAPWRASWCQAGSRQVVLLVALISRDRRVRDRR